MKCRLSPIPICLLIRLPELATLANLNLYGKRLKLKESRTLKPDTFYTIKRGKFVKVS